MKVVFHPEFPVDQRQFEAGYAEISPGLALRFRREIDEAVDAIKASPSGAGHFVKTGAFLVSEFRRRNLEAFPCFILDGWTGELLIFGSLIPSRSDPLTWLTRFPER